MGAELTSRVPAIERRASLVRAAFDIALEEGVAAVTTRSVCARANAHLGVFHGSVAKIVKLEHAWRRLDGRNDDGFQVAPFPG